MCVHFVLESKCKIDGNNEATDTEALFFFVIPAPNEVWRVV